jgi:heat shock protein HslJ
MIDEARRRGRPDRRRRGAVLAAVLAGSALALVVAACSADDGASNVDTGDDGGDDAGGGADRLAGTEWVLVLDESDLGAPNDVEVLLSFDDATGYSASAECNSIGGRYSVEGSSITFEAGAMTEMGCPPPLNEVELEYVALLGAMAEVEVGDGRLTLTGDGASLVYDEREPPPAAEPAALEGEWLVSSIASGDAVSSVLGEPSLTFLGDGAFEARLGCNEASGDYVAGDGDLDIVQVFSTVARCLDDAQAEQEEQISERLLSVERFRPTRSGIDLLDGDGNLLLQLTPAP